MNRILIVEDEQAIAEAVSYALQDAGFDVDCAADGETAVEAARARPYDLMILDLLLPGRSGLDVCRTMRDERQDLPIVMLTARDTEGDRVTGLDGGADDYVTKPFSVAELVSRVRAQLRRRALDKRRGGTKLITLGALELDIARHSANLDGQPLRLTVSEFRLVRLLASEPGRAFTREELVRFLWDSEFIGDRRAIDVHISNLRRKLEANPREPRRLLTVRGVGYRMVAA
jgi:two-component system, OmpR family, alkaline phosphatase synthesis response regulator PhoP